MGNICGKTEDPEPAPSRPLGAAPRPPRSAPFSKTASARVGGPARTLGGGAGSSSSPAPSAGSDDARRRAAEAAEARARAAGKGGKLQAQLSAQKKQSRNSALAEVSTHEVRARDADEAAKARTWD
ncbi:hypothetical protein ESCO_004773 [Escovopsis weberi]|uniref:Uncharacterized protein n=1 Tax=Escovopsis weberi TaxID=150374 RepID=A0A0M8MYB4_ESCWE|nr:hypothetical protein ESCO_004773 [Escovopsis weberi]